MRVKCTDRAGGGLKRISRLPASTANHPDAPAPCLLPSPSPPLHLIGIENQDGRNSQNSRTAPSMLTSEANLLTRNITSKQTELTIEISLLKIEIHPPTPLITVLESSLSDGL